MIVNSLMEMSDAVVAAWLPGTSGGDGIMDALSGKYTIKPKNNPKANTLAFDWPK